MKKTIQALQQQFGMTKAEARNMAIQLKHADRKSHRKRAISLEEFLSRVEALK